MEIAARNALEKRLRNIRILVRELGEYGRSEDYYLMRLTYLKKQVESAGDELYRFHFQQRLEEPDSDTEVSSGGIR